MWDYPSRRGLEHVFATVGQFESGRDARRQFRQSVIEKRCAGFQAPGHGHVVDAFDRVVDQHHGAVQAQGLVHSLAGARAGEVFANELAGRVAFQQPRGLDRVAILGMVAVEERGAIGLIRIVGAVHLRVPMVAGEQFVGALAALHPLQCLATSRESR